MKLTNLLVAGVLLSTGVQALETTETGIKYKFTQIDSYQRINGVYVEQNSTIDYDNLSTILYKKVNGKNVETIDISQQTVDELLKNEGNGYVSKYQTKIQKVDKKEIQFSGSNLTILGEVPFTRNISLSRMKAKSKGRIKYLTIPSNAYQSLYSDSLNLLNGVFGLMSAATLGATNGMEGLKNEPFVLSDYKCERGDSSYSTLTCKYEISFAFAAVESKYSKIEVAKKLSELFDIANDYIGKAGQDYKEGYNSYTEEAYAPVRKDFRYLKSEFEKIIKGQDFSLSNTYELTSSADEIINSSAGRTYSFERSITLKLNQEAADICDAINALQKELESK